MIRNQWYAILESREVSRRMLAVRRLGEELILWRDSDGKAHCLVDRCCHRGVALSAGKMVGDHVQCPFHGLEYDGDGMCRVIPANSRAADVARNYHVPSYPVHEAHGWLWIWWGAPTGVAGRTARDGAVEGPLASDFRDRASDLPLNARICEPDEAPEYFRDLDETFAAATITDPWNTHYSRVLENQLDVVHLPFVHHNTIGRGNRTVIDGPGVQWINNRMLFTYTFNRVDDGTPPLKPSQVPVPPTDRDFKLECILPNLWENHISQKLRIVAAFVPVDNDHTVLYLRTYQKFIRLPVLRWIVGRIFCRFNLVVAHQDRRVVETQTPRPSRLRGGEQLIQGDLPIIEYRKRRAELLAKQKQARAVAQSV
jgi:phenylpropionate dioxygenase-like ring-hydroxylating dioxygenase large terminal subunit